MKKFIVMVLWFLFVFSFVIRFVAIDFLLPIMFIGCYIIGLTVDPHYAMGRYKGNFIAVYLIYSAFLIAFLFLLLLTLLFR
jgi:hypothetical protein